MKRYFTLLLFMLPLFSAMSCASYYAAYGNIGMQNVSGNATVDPSSLTAVSDSMRVSYDIKEATATIYNKSNKMLIIDKANSHYIDNSGTSQSLFNNSITTVSTATSTGASVNLGAVASALGISGRAVTLANGINIGETSTNGISTQIYEQQYIVIPPYASQTLSLPKTRKSYEIAGNRAHKSRYTYGNSPLKSQYLIAYAFDNKEHISFKYERDMFYLSEAGIVCGEYETNAVSPSKTKYVYKQDTKFMYWFLAGGTALLAGGVGLLCAPDVEPVGKVFGGILAVGGIALTIGIPIDMAIKKNRGISFNGFKL